MNNTTSEKYHNTNEEIKMNITKQTAKQCPSSHQRHGYLLSVIIIETLRQDRNKQFENKKEKKTIKTKSNKQKNNGKCFLKLRKLCRYSRLCLCFW